MLYFLKDEFLHEVLVHEKGNFSFTAETLEKFYERFVAELLFPSFFAEAIDSKILFTDDDRVRLFVRSFVRLCDELERTMLINGRG